MSSYWSIPAQYTETGVLAFSGNALIEALPHRKTSKQDFATLVSNYPAPATSIVRRMDEVARIILLEDIAEVVIPFPEYQDAAIDMSVMVMQTYRGRNPRHPLDVQRRHAIAMGGADGVPFPVGWKSHARGFLTVAVSGMGKSTFAKAFWSLYPQVIEHAEYQGSPLQCLQIVYIFLRTPVDGSLLSMCLQFFAEIDRLAATTYLRQAKTERTLARMIELMWRAATAVSLGVIIFDEVINLRCARSPNIEFVLNMFSEIIERIGVSIVVLATPAFQGVIDGCFRNIRKVQSGGSATISPMRLNDEMLAVYMETMWASYYYLKKHVTLTKEAKSAWYDCGAGDTALMSLSYMIAQRNEIGRQEFLDETSFQRVKNKEFAMLKPAIEALKKGDPDSLAAFDDLVSPSAKRMIDKALKVGEPKAEKPNRPDLYEIEEAERKTRERATSSSRRSGRTFTGMKGGYSTAAPELPVEDPLPTRERAR